MNISMVKLYTKTDSNKLKSPIMVKGDFDLLLCEFEFIF